MTKKEITQIIDSLTLEELCGQLLCYDVCEKDDPAEVEKIIAEIKPGGIFADKISKEKLRLFTDMANRHTKLPVIVAGDIEMGPNNIPEYDGVSSPMGWGAADSPELIERLGGYTGAIARKFGYHWAYAPVVDVNKNKDNPGINIRAASDSAKQVVKIMGAYARGLAKNNYVLPCVKHFPGNGMDDRNEHFCTVVNPMSKEEWDTVYGYIFGEMIKQGAPSVMIGHIALSCYDDAGSEPRPAILSYNLITKLLKGKLGFSGCVVSDAMSMIGAASLVPLERLAVEFIKAGGDMVLFPEPDDNKRLINAVKSGELPLERIKDAVFRIIGMKDRARLFERDFTKDIQIDTSAFTALADKIGERSIKIVRDDNHLFPVALSKNSKVLFVNMVRPHFHKLPTGREFDVLRKEFEKRGHSVAVLTNPGHKEVKAVMKEYDLLLVNCKMSSVDYHGGSLRVGWDNIMTFWRAYILQHKKMVFVSYGDPYKLYEFPYLKEYINAFSASECSQRGVVKVVLGEAAHTAKNPVALQGFFKREVE